MTGLRQGMMECPAHSDTKASLSVKESDGKWLVYCFAGCETRDVIEALGLTWDDLFTLPDGRVVVDRYTYTDERGEPVVRVTRTQPKGFWQERWTAGAWKPGANLAHKPLYHLPQVRAAAEAGGRVYVCEGEKDAEAISAQSGSPCATTNVGGAKAWKDEYVDQLRGGDIVLVGDADEAGRERVERVSQSLSAAGIPYRVVFPAVGKDVTDHLRAGRTLSELVEEGPDTSIFSPIDWQGYEIEETEWILKPYIPRRARVLAFGAAGSLKSLWAMWLAAKLTRAGERVAYFSLEMSKSELAKRLKQADPDPTNLDVFTRFQMDNPRHVTYAIRALRDASLIIIDSWSSAHQDSNSNDAIAALDNDVFQPILDQTGATLLILDNVGKDSFTSDGETIEPTQARGASAKGDKMELTLRFSRPVKTNNYRTRITVEKMRLDAPIPAGVVVETASKEIEFYYVHNGMMDRSDPMWPAAQTPVEAPESDEEPFSAVSGVGVPEEAVSTLSDRLALARLKGVLGAVEVPA